MSKRDRVASIWSARIAQGEKICPPGFRPHRDERTGLIRCVPEDYDPPMFFDVDFEPFDPDELGLDPEHDITFWTRG